MFELSMGEAGYFTRGWGRQDTRSRRRLIKSPELSADGPCHAVFECEESEESQLWPAESCATPSPSLVFPCIPWIIIALTYIPLASTGSPTWNSLQCLHFVPRGFQ